ncbi:DUF6461 domain-containing protein [Actinacidiphila glaucinigra]
MTDMTTAAGYAWFSEQYEELMEASCITLVQGLAPEELLGALGVGSASRIAGVAGLGEPSYRLGGDDELFVGAASLGGWSLMVEYNGYLGVTDEAMLPLSRGRTVVSHFRNVNAVDHFCWYQDGAVRLHFEPLFPYHRDGTHPDDWSRSCGSRVSTSATRTTGTSTSTTKPPSRWLTASRVSVWHRSSSHPRNSSAGSPRCPARSFDPPVPAVGPSASPPVRPAPRSP